MYSVQTSPQYTTSSSLIWGHYTEGWNISSCKTAKQPVPTPTNAVIEIQVGAANSSYFYPSEVTVPLGTFIRFHLLWHNISLIQMFNNFCANKSSVEVPTGYSTVDTFNKNVSHSIDYLVNTDSPQWIYSRQNFPNPSCDPGSVFTINPNSSGGTSSNITQNHTELVHSPLSSAKQQDHSICTGCSHTTLAGSPFNGSASQTLSQPLATSFLPNLPSKGTARNAYIPSLGLISLMVSCVLGA